ncbi:hypothetical protein [Caballeronia humi]|uniref:Uncharacterized protein n=1 Tax=Caballeronia humi TaxID=326474 RepID=A0A158EXK7_9BURK|nr:hypothetical protein [Caballeronia humi]SAL12233.1 hypothetical protein AWB65_00326 [Caballeronia humi]
MTTIERAINSIDMKSRTASRGVRIAIAFGMVAAGYGAIVVEALRAGGVGVFA